MLSAKFTFPRPCRQEGGGLTLKGIYVQRRIINAQVLISNSCSQGSESELRYTFGKALYRDLLYTQVIWLRNI